ncbi:MAG: hypothetical protein NTU83_03955 [Candidatus Hydrogenedentes bacterium]|nr:hypothetical protein [Candidatus Hydrogenedentota bacterium]
MGGIQMIGGIPALGTPPLIILPTEGLGAFSDADDAQTAVSLQAAPDTDVFDVGWEALQASVALTMFDETQQAGQELQQDQVNEVRDSLESSLARFQELLLQVTAPISLFTMAIDEGEIAATLSATNADDRLNVQV